MEIPDVIQCYSQIATSFDKTRQYVWGFVKIFIEEIQTALDSHALDPLMVYDIGCGNGKNMVKICETMHDSNERSQTQHAIKGCDLTPEFVEICKQKNLDVVIGDVLDIPFRDKSADYVMCIAVIHHLKTIEERKRAIMEMLRVLKNGGKMLLSVAEFYEYNPETDRKNVLKAFYRHATPIDSKNDVLVRWILRESTGEKIFHRYYHLFDENEMDDIITDICESTKYKCKIYRKMNEFSNWIYFIERM